MKFRTEIEIAKTSGFSLTHNTKILTLGSCFASEIGEILRSRLYNISINPFGAIYNPASLDVIIKNILSQKKPDIKDLINDGYGLWHSLEYHGLFSATDPTEVISKIDSVNNKVYEFINNGNILIILTLGSARTFIFKETQSVVTNCHKLPPSQFDCRDLSVNEIVQYLESSVLGLKQFNPNIRFMLTVSPVRHISYGLHEDKVSKAKLLLACDEICNRYADILYFPAYEILIDDLRDYRFYDTDMIHPSQTAVEYIYDKFKEAFISNEEDKLSKDCLALYKRINHKGRTLTNDVNFIEKTQSIAKYLTNLCPNIEQALENLGYEKL